MNNPEEQNNINLSNKILIVEDSSTIQNMIKKSLMMTPYEIDIAKNGEDALEKIQENDFLYRIVLLDLIMPIMGGIEAIQKIRLLSDNKCNTIVIAITGNHNDLSAAEFEKIGFNGAIIKPLDFQKLLTVLKNPPAPTADAWIGVN